MDEDFRQDMITYFTVRNMPVGKKSMLATINNQRRNEGKSTIAGSEADAGVAQLIRERLIVPVETGRGNLYRRSDKFLELVLKEKEENKMETKKKTDKARPSAPKGLTPLEPELIRRPNLRWMITDFCIFQGKTLSLEELLEYVNKVQSVKGYASFEIPEIEEVLESMPHIQVSQEGLICKRKTTEELDKESCSSEVIRRIDLRWLITDYFVLQGQTCDFKDYLNIINGVQALKGEEMFVLAELEETLTTMVHVEMNSEGLIARKQITGVVDLDEETRTQLSKLDALLKNKPDKSLEVSTPTSGLRPPQLPPFDTHWPDGVKESWFRIYEQIMDRS